MKNSKLDRSFNDIAGKFQTNIYGSTKGRLRHDMLMAYLQQNIDLSKVENIKSLKVLDAGGGTGMMTETLLKLGHKVTLTDISDQALEVASNNLKGYDDLSILHTDILSLDESEQYDLVICHAVLEWVEKPKEVLRKLANLVKPEGVMSVSFFNQDAQLFGNMCYGNFDYVEQGMQVKNRVRLTPNNPLKPKEVLAYFTELPVTIVHKAGIRCFHDYLRDLDKQQTLYEELKSLEIKYGAQEPYLWLGKYFQVIAKKKLQS
ncbi:methyltransferase [Paraglaciecola aquimarina]|uniref:tRNA 5-carboxymethoxyuridine methyltransferase n=1 Tax=Paraglaciecola algarum TaxID=3050085 RepID=A0ABS9D228_9ALTE|nr:methyltransferase [Paraglaciecola sp. G1-23]MCF2946968.1 methyltransferase [Paraglaciecola sp. G1-23]